MKNIKNRALKYFLVFIIISFINDFWGAVIGNPTLNQIFLLFVIFRFKPLKISVLKTRLKNIHLLLGFYIIIIFLNSIISLGQYSSGITVFPTIIKLIIIIYLSPYLKNIQSSDFKYFTKYLFNSLFVLVFLPALFELFMNKNIMSYKGGINPEIFFLRAFTIDKVDFAFNLIMLIGVSFVQYNKFKSVKKYFYLLVSIISSSLLVFSFSSTNVLGLVLSVFLYLTFVSKKKIRTLFIVLSFGLISFFATQNYHYIFVQKYLIQSYKVENTDEFRTAAAKESYKLFLESPFFGHGAESNGYLLKDRLDFLYKPLSSHNILSEFTNFGLIGAIPILLVFFYVFQGVFKQRKNLSELGIIFIIISGPIITRLIFYFHRFDKSLYVIWILLGLIIIYNNANDFKLQNRNSS
ncbi:O-antigen ligase family protein [Flavobacteriaceae bacterium]|nr:O-antigen ligase family protein [Flavobacteriaceae bacterium]